MVQNTAFAQTGAAGGAVEFVSMANVVSAFAAFYGSIDVLKHYARRCSEARKSDFSNPIDALNTVLLGQAMKNRRKKLLEESCGANYLSAFSGMENPDKNRASAGYAVPLVSFLLAP